MFKAYVISVAICFAVLIISSEAAKSRAKREGYKFKYKTSAWEKLRSCLPALIPIFNILMMLVTIFAYEKVYEEIILAKMERCPDLEVRNED